MVVIKVLKTLLIWGCINIAFAANYVWIRSKNNYFSGTCYQVGVQDNQQYRIQVDLDLCRPSATEYVFLKDKGQCYEIDSATKGENFTKSTLSKNCQPPNTIFKYAKFLGRNGCYEVDKISGGEQFFNVVDEKNCQNLVQEVFFNFDTAKKTGDCFTKNDRGEFVKIQTELCKTKDTVFIFQKTSPTDGHCFEEDIRGANYYRQKSQLEKCMPQNTVYMIYTGSEIKNSICLEVDEETKGQKFVRKVRNNYCQQ